MKVTVQEKELPQTANFAPSPANAYFTFLNQLVRVYYLGLMPSKGADSQQRTAYI